MMEDSANPLQEVSANEVDLDAIFNSTDLDHDQLNDIVGHLKELDRQPLQSESLAINGAKSSATFNTPGFVSAARAVKLLTSQNAAVSPGLVGTTFSRLPTSDVFLSTVRANGIVLPRPGVNCSTSAVTVYAANARTELPARVPFTCVTDNRTSPAFSAAMYRQVIPVTCSFASTVGNINNLVSMSSVSALIRSGIGSMPNVSSNVMTMPTSNSTMVGLRQCANPPVQLVNVMQTQDGATRHLLLPQQRASSVSTVGTNQSAVRFTVQAQQPQRVCRSRVLLNNAPTAPTTDSMVY